MTERTCIITRTCGSPNMMIRFVADPNGLLVPDLKGNLPGRGAWLLTSRRLIEEAIRRKAFARSLKKDVRIADDMLHVLDYLLKKAALESLSLARRGGGIITGALKIATAIRAGEVKMILHAKEAAKDGKRKIVQAIHATRKQRVKKLSVLTLFTSEEMSLAFGDDNVVHVAVIKSLAADGFTKRVRRLMAYRDENAMSWFEDTKKTVQEAEME
ncbi:MAG: hypothetical protein JSC188_000980 [Candidatus Tokpelaia sp. JSC188]|nr:MAG: hypothetical protein JSC188_000980 [Candidatus Tokpelaia sp. JSC188]